MKTFRYGCSLLVLGLMFLAASCSLNDSSEAVPSPKNTNTANATAPCVACGPVTADYPQPGYLKMPSKALDIAVTGNGFALMLSPETPGEPNGSKVYYRNTNYSLDTDSWIYLPGPGAVDIATGTASVAWAVTNQGALYKHDFTFGSPSSWTLFTSNNQPTASAVGVNSLSSSELYILGTTNILGGHPVYKYDYSANVWAQLGNQGGIRIHVDMFGRPWIITDIGDIYKAAGTGFTFNGWTYQAKPNNDPVVDIADLFYADFPYAAGMAILSRPSTANGDSNYSTIYWHPDASNTTQSGWSNSLGGVGRRLTGGGGGSLWLIAPDYNIWRKQL